MSYLIRKKMKMRPVNYKKIKSLLRFYKQKIKEDEPTIQFYIDNEHYEDATVLKYLNQGRMQIIESIEEFLKGEYD